ncbi:MAG: HPr-rel-A system PqqD family peptide chaperone [Magnetococcales bacterium]|nr:HPr-rel-A system PqqD family peptide chaperone [Magnetococcales bacterium]
MVNPHPPPLLPDTERWFVPPDLQLHWHCYGETCLVFNPRSGRTHRLEQWVMDLLEALRQGPVSLSALMEHLGLSQEEREGAREKFNRTIWELDRLGLIFPAGL